MKKVLVVFGSMSSEHEISCISAGNILENIDKRKYEITMLGIDKEGIWYEYTGKIQNVKENTWINDKNNKKKIEDIIMYLKGFDVVFPVLHGKYGEDGTIQGLFEIAKVKYVGCKVLGSSIAMDKICSKELVKSTKEINVVDYIAVSKNDNLKSLKNRINKEIGYPLIVKPSREGSSYGISKVDTSKKLMDAIENAFNYDDDILIEKYIDNRKEIECAVIEKDGEIYASTLGEIVLNNRIYDFESKYTNNIPKTIIPADISNEIQKRIREYSKIIFKKLKLNGMARIDYFVSDEKVYFSEVNSIPGFTNTSMYPKILIHDGISYKKIIEILIENC